MTTSLPRYGIDYSWGRPGGAAIRASGYSFAMRYVWLPGDTGKGLTPDERDDLHSNGVAIGLVFETSGNRALDGFFAGIYDAKNYVLPQLTVLDWPEDRPVYFTVDFDVTNEYDAIRNYFLGIQTLLPLARIGVYGEVDILRYCHDNNLAGWFWQSLGWNVGKGVYENANLHQYKNGTSLNGVPTDENRATNPDFGVWEAVQLPTPETLEERVARLETDNAEMRLQLTELNRYVLGRFAILKNAAIDAANPDLLIPPIGG